VGSYSGSYQTARYSRGIQVLVVCSGQDKKEYPDLNELGRETFSSPLSRLYLTVLGTLSGTIAFRDMDIDEVHEEMIRRAGNIEEEICGCH